MTPDAILQQSGLILSQAARESYFQQGFVVAPNALSQDWLQRMREAYLAAVERSRSLAKSNEWFSLQADHSQDNPRIHRIEKLADQAPIFWDLVGASDLVALAADIVGPDVIYRDSMINVKCPGGGGTVAWHQDLPFYPHTNTSTIQILIALYDVPMEQGPLTVISGSHRVRIYQHYDEAGN